MWEKLERRGLEEPRATPSRDCPFRGERKELGSRKSKFSRGCLADHTHAHPAVPTSHGSSGQTHSQPTSARMEFCTPDHRDRDRGRGSRVEPLHDPQRTSRIRSRTGLIAFNGFNLMPQEPRRGTGDARWADLESGARPRVETRRGRALTGVGKNEIIATNRPRHPWIPAYAGMIEWA